MKPDFLEYVHNHVVLGDGALGSYLFEQGVERGRNLDLLNLQAPETVLAAHEEYIRAGSQLIESNTFGANRFKLREAGTGEQARLISRTGAEIAAPLHALFKKIGTKGAVTQHHMVMNIFNKIRFHIMLRTQSRCPA
jgi:methionine synthase I (cobalamin-dependent)